MLKDSWFIVKVQRLPRLQLGFVISVVCFELEPMKNSIIIGS